MIHARVAGTGSFLPGKPVTNNDLVARGIDTSDEWIVERTGIRARHFAERDVASSDLVADVIYQIGALQGLAAAAGTTVRYVKPHGALYNTIAHDARQAKDVITAIRAIDPKLALVALAGSPLVQWARDAGLRVVSEAFADRAYTPQGALVSRREKGAVLHDPEVIAQRMVRLVREGVVEAIDSSTVRIEADSICVHGDSPDAVGIARELRKRFEADGIQIASFMAPSMAAVQG